MTSVGFTGTQKGMTEYQKQRVFNLLQVIEGTEFHNGLDIGSDQQAHLMAKQLGYRLIGHPPTNNYRTAMVYCDELRELKPYLERNKDVVDESEVLIVAPREMKEELRSGTWATYRYAKKRVKEGHKIRIEIVWPKEKENK